MAIAEALPRLVQTTVLGGRGAEARVIDGRSEDALAIADLLRRCASGDAAAWEEIVRHFHRKVYNLCYRFSGSADDAQDLTQEVFIKVYRTVGSFDGEKAAFGTWLTAVTRNLLVDHFRRQRNDRITDSLDKPLEEGEGPTLSERLASAAPGQQELMERRERSQMVQRALQELSPELREAVILRDLQEMDYREIALALGIPEGTVKSRISRGRAELARRLQRSYGQAL